MSWSIGLKLNESFAEVVASEMGQGVSKRWFFNKTPFAQGFQQFLEEHQITDVGQLRVCSHFAESILFKRMGTPPAFLVTDGFENWLEMSLPIQTQYFTVEPQRSRSPLNRDLIFGVTERSNAQGQVEKAVDESELEFLAAKLKMNKVSHVAVGFLHADKNPQNEKVVADYFRGQGFVVYPSHECTEYADEKFRWWRVLLNAYAAPSYNELLENFNEKIDQVLGQHDKSFIASQKKDLNSPDHPDFIETIYSETRELARAYASSEYDFVLYCGLDHFFLISTKNEDQKLWSSPFGKVELKTPQFVSIDPLPTQVLEKSFWGSVQFAANQSGYEPGPMCFGKSLKPTLLDILFIKGELDNIEGLSDCLVKSSKRKIIDSLEVMSKESSKAYSSFDNQDMPSWILDMAYNKWSMKIHAHCNEKKVLCCGPLAPILQPVLRKNIPRAQFPLKEHSEFALCEALSHE